MAEKLLHGAEDWFMTVIHFPEYNWLKLVHWNFEPKLKWFKCKGNSPVEDNVTIGLHALRWQRVDPMVIIHLNEYVGRYVFIDQAYDMENKQP
ncbi:hypothetical protein BTVI_02537 [Pitangus sulphuratus]|nr:hypothetical protein BTVI_02537 [Pitangus sulphuratus]